MFDIFLTALYNDNAGGKRSKAPMRALQQTNRDILQEVLQEDTEERNDLCRHSFRQNAKNRDSKLGEKAISQAVISRLPRYFRYLGDLKADGIERVSSQELSKLMHVTASQIRQDFNNFGGFGQQGYGYNVEYLYEEIGKILGLDREHDMILVGAGNLGQALVNYMNFKSRGFYFKGAFDVNPALFGQKIGSVEIYPLEKLESFVKNNRIDIAVLTIPKTEALKVSEILIQAGIKAIWNFAHVDLPAPREVQIENVHLSDSLMKLSYNIHRYEHAADVTDSAK